jgi:hypothetical protein
MASNARHAANLNEPGIGDVIYDRYRDRNPRREPGKIPACLYLYHIGPFENHRRRVRHYYYNGDGEPLNPERVRELVVQLTQNARRPEPEQAPPPIGGDWQYVVWSRKSYVAIVIDDPTVRFVEGDAIRFKLQGGYLPNHSFYDAQDWTVDVPSAPGPSSECSIVLFVNHITGEGLEDLPAEAERFRFDLNTIPPLRDDIRYPDSGGTNMGPPVPPP